ncbi:MAG TPA: CHASE3 domain-containing protein [Stellaceae bacterium]|jgi:C4-dicarboxylate-specific signal transduction histidine kinase|nr:CHASE3 domain-containing protein [Stellaceae bacterium]
MQPFKRSNGHPAPRRSRLAIFSAAGAAAVAVALVLLSVFALDLNVGRLRQSFGWVQHTDDVLLQLARIEATMIDGESGERGYLLTGDGAYLATFQHARDTVGGEMDRLAALIADNPEQAQRLAALRPLVIARFDEFQRVVDLGPAHLTDALAILDRARSEQWTPKIRRGLAELRRTELALLGERQHRSTRDAVTANLLAIAAGVGALASLGFGLFLLQRQRAHYRIDQLQRELIHVSRLNTMGQTASMLAHEMKQPLTATTNYIRGVRRLLAASGGAPPERISEILAKADAQVDRAAQIVARLRAFVSKGETERRAEDVAATIDEAISLVELGHPGVRLERALAAPLPAVAIDKVQIQQVLINLMRNAAEAMHQTGPGDIRVSARPVDAMVEIAVADRGPGLPKEVEERLFHPFVSTKAEGMGVGLSICRAIVESHGGRIWAEPNPGGGTVFRFTVAAAG